MQFLLKRCFYRLNEGPVQKNLHPWPKLCRLCLCLTAITSLSDPGNPTTPWTACSTFLTQRWLRFRSSSAQRLKRTSFYEPVDGGWTSKSSSWENCRHRIPRSQIAGPLVFVLSAATVTRGKERASSSEALWLGPVGVLLCISTYPLLAAAAAPLGSSVRMPHLHRQQKHVRRAVSELRDAGETVTPTRVARKLAGASKMNARSIRYFVWSKNKQLLLKDGQAKPSRSRQLFRRQTGMLSSRATRILLVCCSLQRRSQVELENGLPVKCS